MKLNDFLSGKKLRGEDFNVEQIKAWFEEEKEGYANLGSKDVTHYMYEYHALNTYHGYRHLNKNLYKSCLSIGGAYGDELVPVLEKLEKIAIVEPSMQLRKENIGGHFINYIEPTVTGQILSNDNSFDLITCFGVLHHIPNVSFVVSEIYRVLQPDGIFLLREPIVSMGDWSNPRQGLTKNERGIPYNLLNEMIIKAGFKMKKKVFCFTKPFDLIWGRIANNHPYNSQIYVRLDAILATLFRFNYRYHPRSSVQKIRPVACFYVLSKDC